VILWTQIETILSHFRTISCAQNQSPLNGFTGDEHSSLPAVTGNPSSLTSSFRDAPAWAQTWEIQHHALF
jgi:hypothetical protein